MESRRIGKLKRVEKIGESFGGEQNHIYEKSRRFLSVNSGTRRNLDTELKRRVTAGR